MDSLPIVSVVIPAFSRPQALHACLDGVAGSSWDPAHVEVIVVDDGSPVSLDPIGEDFRDRLSIRILRQENGGPASARNAGAAAARGRFVAFMDDDCIPGPLWLQSLVDTLEARPDVLASGPVVNGLPGDPYATASQSIASFVTAYYADGRGTERFFTTNNFTLSTKRFNEMGGFDTSIPSRTAEDKEFCDRWREKGYKMVWIPEAVIHHAHGLTLWRFVRQHFDYGRGILAFRLMRLRRSGGRFLPESLSFYFRLILHPLGRERLPAALRLMILLAISQAATAAGALFAALRLDRIDRQHG